MTDSNVVIVTGGASGIGLAAVRALAGEGRRVLVADVVEENLERARAELGAVADQLRFERLDVTREADVVRAVAACEAEFGPVRGLVNSAGTGRDVPALDTDPELFRRILDVNLVGLFTVSREAAKHMRGRGGAIVNVASVSGLRGSVGRSAYGASKAGVINLTQVMAVELASHGIRVNAVAPGPIETPLVAAMHTPAVREKWLRVVPQRRYAAPEEVAGTIAFLLDDARAGFVTGQTVAVDGGFAAGGLLADR